MYKDKEKQKEANRLAAKKYRRHTVIPSGVIPQNVIPENVRPVIPLVINDPDDVPIIPKKYRDDLMSKESAKKLRGLPGDVQRGIEDVLVARRRLGLFDDSEERIERATRYQKWNTGRLNDRANILP